jgi:hypothetical protein
VPEASAEAGSDEPTEAAEAEATSSRPAATSTAMSI